MDFDDILPILTIVLYIVGFIFKKDDKKSKKEKAKKIKNKRNNQVEEKSYIKKFKEKANVLKSEINSALENSKSSDKKLEESIHNEGKIERDYEQINRDEMKDKEMPITSVERKKIEVKEEIKDEIYENEINNKRISINKRSVLNGIIMSEILGKPKALKR